MRRNIQKAFVALFLFTIVIGIFTAVYFLDKGLVELLLCCISGISIACLITKFVDWLFK